MTFGFGTGVVASKPLWISFGHFRAELLMTWKQLTSWIGLAGVDADEEPRASRWGDIFEAPMLALSVWIIMEWYLNAKDSYPESWAVATDRVIWLFFVLETVWLSWLVRDKRRYLLTNWVNLLVILVGVPMFWGNSFYIGALRSLRVLLLLGFLLEMSSTIRKTLAKNSLGPTLLVSLIIIVMAGIFIAAIDPAIQSPWDGIWWAWVTVTTVGYGDLVPESPQGRVFGGLLMVLGLGLFSLITATFSAFLIARDEEELIEKEERILEKGDEIIEKEGALLEQEQSVVSEEGRIIERLSGMEERLEQLEGKLDRLIDRLSVPEDRDDPNPDG